MQEASNEPVIYTIIGGIIVLLFLGVLFLVTLLYHNNRQQQAKAENKALTDAFEKQLLLSQLEMQEQTLNMISQEIHDNVGQTLSFAKVQLNIIRQTGTTDEERLGELKETLDQALSDLRDMARSLSSDRVKLLDLPENIRHQAERLNRGEQVACSVVIQGKEAGLEDNTKLILVRIVQESLQNIIKHSGASEVELSLNYGHPFTLTITDNGAGFDVEETIRKKSGLGLHNILTRARMAGGEALISSVIGQGTIIKISMPHAAH